MTDKKDWYCIKNPYFQKTRILKISTISNLSWTNIESSDSSHWEVSCHESNVHHQGISNYSLMLKYLIESKWKVDQRLQLSALASFSVLWWSDASKAECPRIPSPSFSSSGRCFAAEADRNRTWAPRPPPPFRSSVEGFAA